MSDQIEVRLRYPNLGKAAGDVVSMDAATARAWCQRGLAEHVDPSVATGITVDPHPLASLIDPLTLLAELLAVPTVAGDCVAIPRVREEAE